MIAFHKRNKGYIYAEGSSPIYNSIANLDYNADYTFSFSCDSVTPFGSTLDIMFPTQYDSGLGISIINNTTCSLPCTISGNLVTLSFSQEYNSKSGTPSFPFYHNFE